MGIYIFPIFLFGCAMTGIVFLGVQQAADWAKDEAARNQEASRSSENPMLRPSSNESKSPEN
jgi:hypothetical protein